LNETPSLLATSPSPSGLAVTTIFDWINRIDAENFAGHDGWRTPTEAGFNPTGSREIESNVKLSCAADGTPRIDPISSRAARSRLTFG